MKNIIRTTVASLCITSALAANAVTFPQPTNWPNYLSMGTVSDFSDKVTNAFTNGKRLDFLFAYALYNSAGTVSASAPTQSDIGPTNVLISQSQEISLQAEQTEQTLQTQPVVVVYDMNLSVGAKIDGTNNSGLNPADYNWDNQNQIQWGLENLILNAQALAKAKPADVKKYGAIILNPDLLGQIHKDSEESYQFKNVNINKAVADALSTEGVAAKNIPKFNNDIKGFIAANNYILSTYFQSVNYGWVVNSWAGGNANFVHGSEDDVVTNIETVYSILDRTEVYSGPNKPDFIVFDKFEANDYSTTTSDPSTQAQNTAINMGYLFNARDMSNYLFYVGMISFHTKSPAVLWQIPGGHLIQSSGDKADPATIGTEGDFVFGSGLNEYTPSTIVTNPAQAIPFLSSLGLDTNMPSNYGYACNLGKYLTMDSQGNIGNYDWTHSNTYLLNADNVVAIMWGGGSSTGMVDGIAKDRSAATQQGTLSDGGWLMNSVQNYYGNTQKLS